MTQSKLIPCAAHPQMTPYPKAAGEFRFETPDYKACAVPAPGEEARFNFGCPNGTGNCGSLRIGNGFKPEGQKSWQWNGNVDKPSLTPSINCLSHNPNNPAEKYAGCGWHGFLTDGEFK